MLGLKTSSALYVGVLNSRTMRDRVIDEVGLMKVYGVPTREDARKMLAASSDIAEDRKSGIISITVTDTDPQRASDTGRAYVRNLNLLLAESNVSSARQERIFLDERLEAVWQELDSAQKEFSEFSSKNSAIDIKEQGRAMVDSAAKLQAQLIAAESEIQGLQQIYASENVRVRAAKARIQELRRRLKDMGGKGLGSLEPEVHESNDQYPSIRQLPLLGVRWADLYRRVRIQETVYEILVRQRELAKVQEAKEAPTVRVLDEPLKPDKKAFPSRRSVVLGFTVGALFFAMIWIVASDAWSRISATDPIKVFVAEVSQELEGTWEHLIVRLPFGIAGRLHCRRAQKAAVVTAPVATSEIVREESLVAPERRS
jgi:capsule polysaccharide export protein KpsE/RkpR